MPTDIDKAYIKHIEYKHAYTQTAYMGVSSN